MEESKYKYDFFVSYAAADWAWVQGYLLDALSAAGASVIVEDAFELGAPRLSEFERAIKQSRYVLLVITHAYLADDTTEFVDLLAQTYGLETKKWPVIPIIREDVALPPRLAMLILLQARTHDEAETAVERLLANLRQALKSPKKLPCPYPGMRAYRADDSPFFFGRSQEIKELRLRLRKEPLILIVGPSGSGKSSLALAGLAPTLEEEGWRAVSLRPGIEPATRLTETLRNVLDTDLGQLLDDGGQPLLVVVDQLEELFTVTETTEQRDAFITNLLCLRAFRNVRVVLTMRADFFGELIQSETLWEAVREHRLEITTLDEDNLREAITKPAEQKEVCIEPTLVERLITDAGQEKGMLPFIQETLVLLWKKLERRFLPLQAYNDLVLPQVGYSGEHGLLVAMGLHADATYAELATENQKMLARRTLLRLIQFGEGREDTRRQQPEYNLRAVGDDPDEFETVLSYLVNHRLLTTSAVEASDHHERTVDLSHEALIRGWPKLRSWIKERRAAELMRRRLEAKVTDWVRYQEQYEKDEGGLLDEYELKEAEEWLSNAENNDLGSSENLIALVETSRHVIDTRKAQEEERRQRELEQERQIAEEQRRRAEDLRRSLYRIIGLALVALVLAVSAVFFWRQSAKNAAEARRQEATAVTEARRAEEQAAFARISENAAKQAEAKAIAERNRALINESHTLVLLSEQQLRTDPVAAVAIARKALPSVEDPRPYLPEAEYGLIEAIQRSLEREYLKVSDALDGDQIAADSSKVVAVADQLNSRGRIGSLPVVPISSPGGEAKPDCVALRPQTDDYAYCDGTSLWLQSTQVDSPVQFGRKNDSDASVIKGIVWSHDGQWLAAWDDSERLMVWHFTGRLPVAILDEQLSEAGCIYDVAWSLTGRHLVAVASDGRLRGWQIDGNSATLNIEVNFYAVDSMCTAAGVDFVRPSREEEQVLTWGSDGKIQFWSLTGERLETIIPIEEQRDGRLNGVKVALDGRQLVAFAEHGPFYLLSADRDGPIKRFEGHTRSVGSVLWRESSSYLITCSADGTARLWDTATETLRNLIVFRGHKPPTGHSITGRADVYCLQWLDDGTLLTAGEDGTLRTWRALDNLGQPVCVGEDEQGMLKCNALGHPVADYGETITFVRWRDDRTLLTVDASGTARLETLGPDDRRLQTKFSNVVRGSALWDPSGHYVFCYDGYLDNKQNAAQYAQIWDVESASTTTVTISGPIKAARWLSSGILFTDEADRTYLLDPNTRDRVELSADDSTMCDDPLPPICDAKSHGDRLATAHKDGSLCLWEIHDGTLISENNEREPSPFVTIDSCTLQWKQDGSALLSAGSDSFSGFDYVSMWNVETLTRLWHVEDFPEQASANGQALLSPGEERFVAAAIDRSVYMLDSSTGDTLESRKSHSRPIDGLEWVSVPTWESAEARLLLLSWAQDGSACLWDWNAARDESKLTEILCVTDYMLQDEDRSAIQSASISPDRRRLVTAGASGILRIWPVCLHDPESVQELAERYLTRSSIRPMP